MPALHLTSQLHHLAARLALHGLGQQANDDVIVVAGHGECVAAHPRYLCVRLDFLI